MVTKGATNSTLLRLHIAYANLPYTVVSNAGPNVSSGTEIMGITGLIFRQIHMILFHMLNTSRLSGLFSNITLINYASSYLKI